MNHEHRPLKYKNIYLRGLWPRNIIECNVSCIGISGAIYCIDIRLSD